MIQRITVVVFHVIVNAQPQKNHWSDASFLHELFTGYIISRLKNLSMVLKKTLTLYVEPCGLSPTAAEDFKGPQRSRNLTRSPQAALQECKRRLL